MPRKGENIYKRSDGRWEGRYIKSRDINNKAKYGYVYASTYAEAKYKLSELKAIPVRRQSAAQDSKTMEYICMLWRENIRTQVKQSTYVKYYNIIQNHILPCLGKRMISSINTAVIRNYIDEKLTQGKKDGSGGLSAKTTRDIISVIKLIFQYATSVGIECYCDFDSIKIKAQEKSINILTQNEQERFTSYLMNEIDNTKLGILISLYAGLRIGEVCALKFEDISDGIIHIRKTMQRIQTLSEKSDKKTEVVITPPKSSSSIREVPIPDFLNNIIMNFYTPKAYVLTGAATYIEPRTLQNRFKAHAEKCGLYGINFHICRHTYASVCVEVGVEIKSLSEMLGHSSVNITLNQYVHSSMELKRKNIKKLQEKFIYSPS